MADRKQIIVIGAGAAGLMAAAAAADGGAQVTVLEKNEKAGKKLYITGKGRCNLTNACDVQDFFDHVVRNPKFLYSAVYGFDASAVMQFMRDNGCEVKTERGNRVFPVSDHASDVTKALLHHLRGRGVTIRTHCEVAKILTDAPRRVTGVQLRNGQKLPADAVILCTGGLSYPSTGSTGDGLRMAGALGLRTTAAAPSLVPLTVKEAWCRELQGLSLRNVQLTLLPEIEEESSTKAAETGSGSRKKQRKKKKRQSSRPLYTGFGEMLFTHYGISGPLVLTASCYTAFEEAPQGYLLLLDLKPALTQEQLEARLQREFDAASRKQLGNVLRALFTARLAESMASLSGLGAQRTVSTISEREIKSLAALIKAVPMHATGTRGFPEAIITRGGLDVRQFDPYTMECREVSGLYAAGEVLDVDAHTGGFNLQIAWSTGHLAGMSAAEETSELG